MVAGMPSSFLGKVGLAAVILFAPGGFILGAALAADQLRRRHTPRQ
jgi:voltage-gated potassium channel Kch